MTDRLAAFTRSSIHRPAATMREPRFDRRGRQRRSIASFATTPRARKWLRAQAIAAEDAAGALERIDALNAPSGIHAVEPEQGCRATRRILRGEIKRPSIESMDAATPSGLDTSSSSTASTRRPRDGSRGRSSAGSASRRILRDSAKQALADVRRSEGLSNDVARDRRESVVGLMAAAPLASTPTTNPRQRVSLTRYLIECERVHRRAVAVGAAPADRSRRTGLQTDRARSRQRRARRRARRGRHRQHPGRSAEETRRHRQRDPARSQRVGRTSRGDGIRRDGDGVSRSLRTTRKANTSCCSIRSTARRTSTSTFRSGRSSRCWAVPSARLPSESTFLQPGNAQVAAGYAVYGPQTQLVLTLGRGVVVFTLERETQSWFLTDENVEDPGRHEGIRDQHEQSSPLGGAGLTLRRRTPRGQQRPSRQGLQHAVDRVDGRGRASHPVARWRLHVSA